MKLGLRGRLLGASLGLIAVAMLAADAYLSRALDRTLSRRIADDLRVRLALVERLASISGLSPDERAGWDELADDAGRRARARVTFLRLDGVVLGDSELSVDELSRLENHAGRPEIAAALQRGEGASTRRSATVGERMMYVAMPLVRDGARAGIIRAAVPLARVDAVVARSRWLIFFASLLALGVAGVVALAVTRRISEVVRRLTEAARRMAAGDLTARARVEGSDELAALGRALDHLAAGLQASLSQLRADRDLTSGILEAMSEGVFVVGADGRIALVNPALREMLLLPPDVVGRTPLEVIRHAELSALLARARREPAAAGELEIGGVRPRRLLVHAAPLPGDPPGLLAVAIDVTDLRRLESLRRDFVANVSHELRTPVTAIRSAAETLDASVANDPAAARTFVAMIERNAERLQHLVEDLLDLSRIESRQVQLRLEPIDAGEAFAGAIALATARAERRGITLRNAAPPGVVARADRRALEQVLANLVDNAIKYGRAEGTVVLSASAAEGDAEAIRLAVTDDGPGIAASHLPRLFERFYRVDAGRSREQGGTGLGLAIVKHLVEAMGGRVGVDSTTGRGSTFWLTLPRD